LAYLRCLSSFPTRRSSDLDGTLTVLIRAIDRWFWLIPLSAERTSVGVVLDSETFRKSKLSAEEFLDQALAEQPITAKRMTSARRDRKSTRLNSSHEWISYA